MSAREPKQRGRVDLRRQVCLPLLPNFLRLDPDVAIDVAELSDTELRRIGRAWTEALLQHAAERRSKAKP